MIGDADSGEVRTDVVGGCVGAVVWPEMVGGIEDDTVGSVVGDTVGVTVGSVAAGDTDGNVVRSGARRRLRWSPRPWGS